jgi:flagellar basal-body rod protein FlgB
VDIGLYEPIFRILDELAPSYQLNGYIRERMGPGTVNVVPHSHYPTKDGRWIAIACTSDKIFARLADAMGVPEFAEDGKWGKIRQREAARAEVDAYVGNWTSQFTRDELLALCEKAQVPCGPVYAIDEIFKDPQYKARDFDFRSALAQATGAPLPGTVVPAQTAAGHMSVAGGSNASPSLQYRAPLQTSLDGNTVDMDMERAAFADNTLRYEASLRFINGQIRTLMSAISGQGT